MDLIVFLRLKARGEVAELVEGARLLSGYTGLNLYRGFKSLPLRQRQIITPSYCESNPAFCVVSGRKF